MGLPCSGCGGATAADGWCPACLTITRQPPPVSVGGTAVVPRQELTSRVTFGPVGKTLWTVFVVLLPVPVLWLTEGLAGWGLAGLWWGVITPWSMRDLWRRK